MSVTYIFLAEHINQYTKLVVLHWQTQYQLALNFGLFLMKADCKRVIVLIYICF